MTATLEPLPHLYPFRFADRTVERTGPGSGRVRALVSANARGVREGRFPVLTLAELIAQSALLLEGGDPHLGRTGFLAGLSDFAFHRVPEAGDELVVDVKISALLGPVVRFEGTITDGEGRPVAQGAVTVRKGTP